MVSVAHCVFLKVAGAGEAGDLAHPLTPFTPSPLTRYWAGSSAVMPSAHQRMQYLHLKPWRSGRELVEVGLR